MLSLGGEGVGVRFLRKYKDPFFSRMRSLHIRVSISSQGSKQPGGAKVRGDLGWEFEGRELFAHLHLIEDLFGGRPCEIVYVPTFPLSRVKISPRLAIH